MSVRPLKLWKGLAALSLLLSWTVAKAELVFSAPPWLPEAEQRAMFEPIAQSMSEWLGTKVKYQHNSNFTMYSVAMRGGKFDLVFDGPQFNAWRMKHLNHQALVTLPEKLEFMVLSSNRAVGSLDELVGKRVCGQAPPQLGTLLVMSQFSNPAQKPQLQSIKGEPKVFEELKAGKCTHAILRNNIYSGMNEGEKAKYKVVFTTRPVPNDGLSAGPNVTEAQRRILIEKMTDARSLGAFRPLFDMKVKSASQFVKADLKEYQGLESILEDMSYGW